ALRDGQNAARTRRRVAGGAALVGVMACLAALSITVAAKRREERALALCRPGEEEIASIWNAERAARTREVCDATGSPLADTAWRKAEGTLGRYVSVWRAAHRRTCEQTIAEGEAALSTVGARRQCLSEGVEMLRAVAASFARADAALLEQAPARL